MLKAVSFFSGIGAFEKALSNCKIPHEIADFNLCSQISNTQLYKLAGNSICVPVLEELFKKLF